MADASGEKNGTSSRSSLKMEQLLTAAANLMAREGYDHTSIRDVARESGFSLAGMYYYFQSKEDLLFKIQHRTFGSLLEEQERSCRGGGTAEEKLRRLIQNHLSFYTKHFNEMKICTFELQSLSGERYREIEQLRRRYYKIAAEIVGEILDSADRPGGGETDIRHYTLFIFGMLNWIFSWFDPKRDAPVEDLGDRLLNLALYGLRGRDQSHT